MEFGSTHVYLVRSSGPTLSDVNVASGFQEESAEVRYVDRLLVKLNAVQVNIS